MSTANKLTYLNVTKQKLKQAINNIGGEVTDETTFREYVNQLENAYDRLPKTEFEEGESVTLENTLKGKLDFDDGKVGIGQSSQESTQGYNLYYIDKNDYQQTWNNIDVTLTRTGYKVYSANSQTSTGFTIASRKITLPAGIYTFVLKHISALRVAISNTSYAVLGIVEIGSTYGSFAINQETDVTLTLIPANGASYNEENEIMLYSGNYDSTKSYEQYTGGYASPSPNWEQEVKCVAGINILDDSKLTLFANNRYISTIDYLNKGQIAVNNKKTYSLVYLNNTLGDIGLFEYDSSNTKTTINAITLTNGTHKVKVFNLLSTTKTFGFYAGGDNSVDTISQFLSSKEIMLLEGDYSIQTIPSYTPYNTIEEVVSGINYANYSLLFNNTDCYSISNDNISLLQNDSRATTLIDGTTWGISLKKGTYTLYTSGTGISPQIQIIGKVIGQIVRVNYSQLVTFNLSQDDIVAIKYLNTASFPINLGKVMIIEGTIANTPTYEPYITPKTYQFSLGDHKFYGIGTYRDYILRTTGKNLAHIELEGKYREYRYGSIQTNADFNGYIASVKPNTSYIANGNGLVGYPARLSNLCFFDSEMTYIDGNAYTSADKTFTTPNNCYYVTIAVSNYISNFQIEEGSTASDYQPYGVGNWYKGGKILRYDFTGQEEWTRIVVTGKPLPYFRLYLTSQPLGIASTSSTILSNRYKGGTDAELVNNDYPTISMSGNANNQLNITQNLATADEFKAYLTNNPTYVCYPRVTAEFTPITGELATQLEAFWNAQSNTGTTILESNGDLPLVIKVRGLKGE